MIPKVVHFIYLGGRPFSLTHMLAVLSAQIVNGPDSIILHCSEMPVGPWWERIAPLVTINHVSRPNEVFGRPVKMLAHMADVIRLRVLKEQGGIYLDLDVICVNPFDSLLGNTFVMGIEPGTGLCNAVILAAKGAPFIDRWFDEYRTFDAENWNFHSVVLPSRLAIQFPDEIQIQDKYAFFYPSHNDPVHSILWGKSPDMYASGWRMSKNAVRLLQYAVQGRHTVFSKAHYGTFHHLRSGQWHMQRLRDAFCLHLWESLWHGPYLSKVDRDFLLESPVPFAALMRDVFGRDRLSEMTSPP